MEIVTPHNSNSVSGHSTQPLEDLSPGKQARRRGTFGIRIIGEGPVGKKLDKLIQKTSALQDLGFRCSPRTILAQSFIDDFLQYNKTGVSICGSPDVPDDIAGKIMAGQFSTGQQALVLEGIKRFGSKPLMIRASASGDSRGTGIYESKASDSSLEHVLLAVKAVIASYFSPSALDFRSEARSGEAFGISIEPIIGMSFKSYGYPVLTPVLSGSGYTSTPREGPLVRVVPGIGGGVQSRLAEKITEEAISQYDCLGNYIFETGLGFYMPLTSIPKRESALLRSSYNSQDLSNYRCLVFEPPSNFRPRGEITHVSLAVHSPFGMLIDRTDLGVLFRKMNAMEAAFSCPQYFEWALTYEKDEPIYWITQIDDVDRKSDPMNFGEFHEILFEGHTVTGTGEKECGAIVKVWNGSEKEALRKFNSENSNYILYYSSIVTTSAVGSDILPFEYYSHASVFLELQDARHSGDPASHLQGRLEESGKFFAVMTKKNVDGWEDYHPHPGDGEACKVKKGKFRVIASEAQNRLIVVAAE